ncbi:MAG: hypothetical protein ACRDSP_09510 [Pseudonocardiaceae bacterium]
MATDQRVTWGETNPLLRRVDGGGVSWPRTGGIGDVPLTVAGPVIQACAEPVPQEFETGARAVIKNPSEGSSAWPLFSTSLVTGGWTRS